MEMRKTTSFSEVQEVASTKTIWRIKGWTGPLSKVARSQAACFMTVGDVNLRFHPRYFDCLDDSNEEVRNQLLYYGYSFPYTPLKCSGYSLMMDVLNEPTEKLIFLVDIQALQPQRRNTVVSRENVVAVTPESPKRDLTAIKMFHPTRVFDEYRTIFDESEDHFQQNYSFGRPDIQCALTVTTYKMNNFGTDDKISESYSKTLKPSVDGLVKDMKNLRMDPDNFSDVVLVPSDGSEIKAHRFILAARSLYFREWFEKYDTVTRIELPKFDAKFLTMLVHWMYFEEISEESLPYLDKMCEAALEFKMSAFMEDLDGKITTFGNPGNMYSLAQIAKKYNLKNSVWKLEKKLSQTSVGQSKTVDASSAKIASVWREKFGGVRPDSSVTTKFVPQGPSTTPGLARPNELPRNTCYADFEFDEQDIDNIQYTNRNSAENPATFMPSTSHGTASGVPVFTGQPFYPGTGSANFSGSIYPYPYPQPINAYQNRASGTRF